MNITTSISSDIYSIATVVASSCSSGDGNEESRRIHNMSNMMVYFEALRNILCISSLPGSNMHLKNSSFFSGSNNTQCFQWPTTIGLQTEHKIHIWDEAAVPLTDRHFGLCPETRLATNYNVVFRQQSPASARIISPLSYLLYFDDLGFSNLAAPESYPPRNSRCPGHISSHPPHYIKSFRPCANPCHKSFLSQSNIPMKFLPCTYFFSFCYKLVAI